MNAEIVVAGQTLIAAQCEKCCARVYPPTLLAEHQRWHETLYAQLHQWFPRTKSGTIRRRKPGGGRKPMKDSDKKNPDANIPQRQT